MKRTCKYCNKTFTGTNAELKKVFVNNSSCKNGITHQCKRCRTETKEIKESMINDDRVTLEDLIEVLDSEGYYTSKKKLDEFIEDSYLDCSISKDKWLKSMQKRFYKHGKIKEVLNGEVKKCSKCDKWFPLSMFYNGTNNYKGKKYKYKYPHCKKCHMGSVTAYIKGNGKEKRKEIEEKRNVKYREAKTKRMKEWRERNPLKVKNIQAKKRLRDYLKANRYVIEERKISILMELREKDNIRYYKDLVNTYGGAVCLKKI